MINNNATVFNVKLYGAKGDTLMAFDGAGTASSTTFTCTAGRFKASDIGKVIVIDGIGTSGRKLVTTITAVASSTSITLNNAAVTTASSQQFSYGTDDTTAIQAAILACDAYGGGKPWFPYGVYIINGPIQTNIGTIDMNCQLYIPLDTVRSTQKTFNLEGEYSASAGNIIQSPFATGVNTDMGVTLYSTYTGSRSTTNKGTAIIGTGATGTLSFNSNSFTLKNINFKTVSDPNGAGPEIGGCNAKYAIGFSADNCTYAPDTIGSSYQTPTRDISGFETTENSGGASYLLTNLSVCGLKWGYILGEHVSANQICSAMCVNGFGIKPGYHSSSFLRIGAFWCVSPLNYYSFGANPAPNAVFNIQQFDIEYGEGNTGKFYNTVNSIEDSTNKFIANINYCVIEQNVGLNNSKWAVNGATGCVAVPIGTAITATPGGASTNLQFNDGGVFNGLASLTWNKTNSQFTVQSSASTSFAPFILNNSVGHAGAVFTSAATTAQTFMQFVNDRASLASYGDIIYGGSANVLGNLFGVSRADKMMIFADGASNLGLYIGTLQAKPMVIGTNNLPRITIASGGNTRLHAYGLGTNTGTAAYALTVDASGNILESSLGGGSGPGGSNTQLQYNNSGAFGGSANLTYNGTTLALSGSGNDIMDITGTGAAGNALHLNGTNAAGQISMYLENNRGSFASYGGFLYGGSTNAIGNLFGVSRADKLALFADGASNAGMLVGTLQAQPLIFGTNNTEWMRIASSGAVKLSHYGSGTNTGTVAKYLAVDASGNIIEDAGTSVATLAAVTSAGNTTTNAITVGNFTNTGTITHAFSTHAANYTVSSSDVIVEFSTASACTLPTSSGNAGRILYIKNKSGGNISLSGMATGELTLMSTYGTTGASIMIYSDGNGNGWHTLAYGE